VDRLHFATPLLQTNSFQTEHYLTYILMILGQGDLVTDRGYHIL